MCRDTKVRINSASWGAPADTVGGARRAQHSFWIIGIVHTLGMKGGSQKIPAFSTAASRENSKFTCGSSHPLTAKSKIFIFAHTSLTLD
eukprot:scaffold42199_cov36-Tisochrysis_lutea.AAC.3